VAPGEAVSRDELIDLLWPDPSPGAPLSARLSVQLSAVRRILGRGVVADRASVHLDCELVHVDLAEFYAAAANGDPTEVVSLYRGDLLPEDLYEPWTKGPRNRARTIFVSAVRTLLQQATHCGEHERAIDLGYRLLATDPYDDFAYHGVISALAADGRLGEARRAHELYAARMSELGVDAASFADIVAVRPVG
jgi:DNA-binding SARP family transcriptional activator